MRPEPRSIDGGSTMVLPSACACCLGPEETRVTYRASDGYDARRKAYRYFEMKFPYCRACARHARWERTKFRDPFEPLWVRVIWVFGMFAAAFEVAMYLREPLSIERGSLVPFAIWVVLGLAFSFGPPALVQAALGALSKAMRHPAGPACSTDGSAITVLSHGMGGRYRYTCTNPGYLERLKSANPLLDLPLERRSVRKLDHLDHLRMGIDRGLAT